MYLVYLLKSDKYSYVGMTNDFTRRLRQHNKEIKGGARYTSKRDSWYPVLIIDGFQDIKSAMQCEWRLKRGKKGVEGRIRYLNEYLSNNDCPLIVCVIGLIAQLIRITVRPPTRPTEVTQVIPTGSSLPGTVENCTNPRGC